MKKLNGVIMAAGMGTRLLPKTKNKPKGMLVVNRETLIARQIRILKECNAGKITIITACNIKASYSYWDFKVL